MSCDESSLSLSLLPDDTRRHLLLRHMSPSGSPPPSLVCPTADLFLSVPGLCVSLPLSVVSQTRSRSWRQRNHRRPVLRRLIIGESGGGRGLRARGRWVRGWHRGVASSRFMALAATRDPTIRRSTIPEAWGNDANIAFSVAFLSLSLSLSPAACRYDSSFFGGLPRRYCRPAVNLGCPATRERCGEPAGRRVVGR